MSNEVEGGKAAPGFAEQAPVLRFGCGRCGHGEGRLHELKTWPVFYNDVLAGRKTFELRRDDRGFEVGDILQLREYDPETNAYTGRFVFKRVTTIVSKFPGLAEGYVIMGLQPC